MRELTDNERAEQDHRRAAFNRFLEERVQVLADFVERLELPNPSMVLVDAERYLPSVDGFMKNQAVLPEDRVWILTRLGYFIGDLLIQRFGGGWFLNEIPDSRYFLRYVVGKFTRVPNRNAMVDPFYVADLYLAEPPGRSLTIAVNEVVNELQQS
jgi:hypothetical protein